VSTALRLRTWFSIDPQPASINPTTNISIVFICAFVVDCDRIIPHSAIKNDSGAILRNGPGWWIKWIKRGDLAGRAYQGAEGDPPLSTRCKISALFEPT
jgi:hypothetical protein